MFDSKRLASLTKSSHSSTSVTSIGSPNVNSFNGVSGTATLVFFFSAVLGSENIEDDFGSSWGLNETSFLLVSTDAMEITLSCFLSTSFVDVAAKGATGNVELSDEAIDTELTGSC